MRNNTSEEHLDNQASTQSENFPAAITSTNYSETSNNKKETKKMEVHHHPELHHNEKPWKEYFLEFLMTF